MEIQLISHIHELQSRTFQAEVGWNVRLAAITHLKCPL